RPADDLHAGRCDDSVARRRHPTARGRAMNLKRTPWATIGWKKRSQITGWVLGTLTLVFLTYQWLPILTLGLLSFAGPTGGTPFPQHGTSLHWSEALAGDHADA